MVKTSRRTTAAFLAFVLAALCLTMFTRSPLAFAADESSAASSAAENGDYIKGVDDLKGKNIGVQLGTTGDIYVTRLRKRRHRRGVQPQRCRRCSGYETVC